MVPERSLCLHTCPVCRLKSKSCAEAQVELQQVLLPSGTSAHGHPVLLSTWHQELRRQWESPKLFRIVQDTSQMFPKSWSPKQCEIKGFACRKNTISIYGRVHEIALKDLQPLNSLPSQPGSFWVSSPANPAL